MLNAQSNAHASGSWRAPCFNRIALKEAKETRFRLRVCRRRALLGPSFDTLVQESDELVRILATIVHNARRNLAMERARQTEAKGRRRLTPWALGIEH
jgi:hypothetical protein